MQPSTRTFPPAPALLLRLLCVATWLSPNTKRQKPPLANASYACARGGSLGLCRQAKDCITGIWRCQRDARDCQRPLLIAWLISSKLCNWCAKADSCLALLKDRDSRMGISAIGREIEQVYPQWREVLEERHIIAAIRNMDALDAVEKSATETVYLLFGNPLNVADLLKRVRSQGKLPLVNLDLLSGFSRDAINAENISPRAAPPESFRPTGKCFEPRGSHGLITVQRTFALDSAAIEAGLRTIRQFTPDAVEILPAVAAPRVFARFREVHPHLRIVAGGLDFRSEGSRIPAGGRHRCGVGQRSGILDLESAGPFSAPAPRFLPPSDSQLHVRHPRRYVLESQVEDRALESRPVDIATFHGRLFVWRVPRPLHDGDQE